MIIFLDSILEFFHQVFQWFINLFTKEKELNNLIVDENNQIKINIQKLRAPKRKKENEKLDDNKIIKDLTKLTPRSIRYQNRLDRQLEREKKDEEFESSSSSPSEEEEEEEEEEMDTTIISNLNIPLYTSSPISNNISKNSKLIFDKPEDKVQSSTNGTLNQVQLRKNQSLNLSPNQDRFFLTNSFLLESSSSSSSSDHEDENDDCIYTYKNNSGKLLRSGENYPLELFTYNKNDISDDSNDDDDKRTNKRYILIVC